MNENTQILLNQYKNVDSVNVDNYQKLKLSNKVSEINEYNIENFLSATEIFDAEREENDIYRIYGRIEYLSLLNGLSSSYINLSDFFLSQKSGNTKNIYNSFEFYLLKPASSGYTSIIGNSTEYVRYFEVIATSSNFEIFDAGYSNNVYGNQIYSFNFNVDIDVTLFKDNFGIPVTELFLYARYIPAQNKNHDAEKFSGTSWGTNGISIKTLLLSTIFNIGDKVYGDLINYSKSDFLQTQIMPQTYYIATPYFYNNVIKYLVWNYNPFISFQLKYFNSSLMQANTGSTSYGQVVSIPTYATFLGNGNFVWKDILPQGFIDPITNLGVSYPFINKKRYLFSQILLTITPDLNDSNTNQIFNEIKFGAPTTLNTIPITNLNDIGKPCQ